MAFVHRLKQDGKIAEAIKVMNSDILKDFASDESSWEELAELYVARCLSTSTARVCRFVHRTFVAAT